MLQIISGKFFEAGFPINESDEDAVLHSNYAWIGPIRTTLAEIRPVDYAGTRIATYTVRYKSRYQPYEGDIMVQPTAAPAVSQLRRLATLWFGAIFHADLVYVETQCREHERYSTSEIVPSKFVRHFFDTPKRGTAAEVEGFGVFVDKAIAMPRATFKAYMNSVSMFVAALESIGTNFDLAYSMFVYLLEALSQTTVSYAPAWEDYDQNVRLRLNPLLDAGDLQIASQIKAALLEGQQLKLTKRFKDFVAQNVEASFFTSEAAGLERALPRSQMPQALGNLYKTRSGFVHELRTLHDQLRMPGFATSDIFTWQNDVFLTMGGLVRLTRHVLLTFVQNAPAIVTEDYPNWRAELPGIISAEMAPEYWIWEAAHFTPQKASQRLSGLLEMMTFQRLKPAPALPNLDALMVKIEALVGQANPADRIAMIVTYYTYNMAMPEDLRHQGYNAFLCEHRGILEDCHPGLMAADLLRNEGAYLRWGAATCDATFEQYLKHRFKEGKLNLPPILEAAMALAIANQYHLEEQAAQYQRWAEFAAGELAGNHEAQLKIIEIANRGEPIPFRLALGDRPKPPQEDLQMGGA